MSEEQRAQFTGIVRRIHGDEAHVTLSAEGIERRAVFETAALSAVGIGVGDRFAGAVVLTAEGDRLDLWRLPGEEGSDE